MEKRLFYDDAKFFVESSRAKASLKEHSKQTCEIEQRYKYLYVPYKIWYGYTVMRTVQTSKQGVGSTEYLPDSVRRNCKLISTNVDGMKDSADYTYWTLKTSRESKFCFYFSLDLHVRRTGTGT